jgi:hypothetical protein
MYFLPVNSRASDRLKTNATIVSLAAIGQLPNASMFLILCIINPRVNVYGDTPASSMSAGSEAGGSSTAKFTMQNTTYPHCN